MSPAPARPCPRPAIWTSAAEVSASVGLERARVSDVARPGRHQRAVGLTILASSRAAQGRSCPRGGLLRTTRAEMIENRQRAGADWSRSWRRRREGDYDAALWMDCGQGAARSRPRGHGRPRRALAEHHARSFVTDRRATRVRAGGARGLCSSWARCSTDWPCRSRSGTRRSPPTGPSRMTLASGRTRAGLRTGARRDPQSPRAAAGRRRLAVGMGLAGCGVGNVSGGTKAETRSRSRKDRRRPVYFNYYGVHRPQAGQGLREAYGGTSRVVLRLDVGDDGPKLRAASPTT